VVVVQLRVMSAMVEESDRLGVMIGSVIAYVNYQLESVNLVKPWSPGKP
jgi:hypothetical protein